MKLIFLNIALICMLNVGSVSFFSTNFIGMQKNAIEQMIKENHKALKLNTSNTNTAYKYLKFEDKINEITVLFFLDDQDKCTMVRLMSDYSNINDMLSEINTSYTATGKNCWQYTDNNKVHLVNLEEGDWFYTITIKEKK